MYGGVELKALTVNGAGSLKCDVLCVDGEEQGPVSIHQRGIAAQGNGVDGVILLSIGAPKQFSSSRDMQGHIALEFDCADLKCSRWDENRAATIACAHVDSRLKRGSVECDAVALGSEVANIVDAAPQIASGSSMRSGFDGNSGFSQQTHSGCSGECACRRLPQPLAAGQEEAVDFRNRLICIHRGSLVG